MSNNNTCYEGQPRASVVRQDGDVGVRNTEAKPGRRRSQERPNTESPQAIFRRRLAQKVSIPDAGEILEVSTLEALIARLINDTRQGDHRAMNTVLKLPQSLKPKTRDFTRVLPLLSDEQLNVMDDVAKIYEDAFGKDTSDE